MNEERDVAGLQMRRVCSSALPPPPVIWHFRILAWIDPESLRLNFRRKRVRIAAGLLHAKGRDVASGACSVAEVSPLLGVSTGRAV